MEERIKLEARWLKGMYDSPTNALLIFQVLLDIRDLLQRPRNSEEAKLAVDGVFGEKWHDY